MASLAEWISWWLILAAPLRLFLDQCEHPGACSVSEEMTIIDRMKLSGFLSAPFGGDGRLRPDAALAQAADTASISSSGRAA
ncbi:MAG: hypothetical protein WCJ69_13075 [Betaproteobacteria bacterium]|jgi:hypothetical protein